MSGRRIGAAPVLLLAVGVASVSSSALIAHRALAEATPLMLASWRMGLASLAFLGSGVVMRTRSGGRSLRQDGPIVALAGVVLAVHFLLWFASLRLAPVAVATLLVCTTPLWTALFQTALKRARAARSFWVALITGLVGVAVVLGPSPFRGSRLIEGELLALGGGAVFAVYLLAVDRLEGMPSTQIVRGTYSVAAIVLWAAALATGRPTIAYSRPVWEAILLLTALPQITGHTLINHSLKFFDAHVVAFAILAEPVIAAALAAALLHQRPALATVVGGIVVLGSMAVVLAGSTGRTAARAIEEL